MADIDPELVERAIRWCAEAGRQTTAAATKAALASLTWDELLAARALLADPPPILPLGPFALADIARGAPADVAAERERAGRYGAAVAEAVAGSAARGGAPASPPPAPRGRKRVRTGFVVRRASERTAPAEPPPRALPLADELLLDEGRAVLERLLRKHGGRRARLAGAIANGWRRADGSPAGDAELDKALAHHGMGNAFAIRERDEILHALRAAGGVRAVAAAALGLEPPGLEEALDRLGARGDAERVRDQRRRELRSRGTLTQRAHLLLDETERLDDLGLLQEFTRDLAERLPDHLRALSASGPGSPAEHLGRSLSLDPTGVERLLQRTGVRLDALPSQAGAPLRTFRKDERAPRPGGGRPPSRDRASGARRPGPGGRPSGGARPGADRPGARTQGGGRPGGARPGGRPSSGGRTGSGRPGGRPGGRPPSGGRPGSGGRKGGPRPPGRR